MNGLETSSLRSIQIIRHASTKLNSDDITVDRLRGWTDIPLSEEGLAQARVLAEEIAEHPPDFLFCSDLTRCITTAAIISERIGIPLEKPTIAFRPWNVGKFAGGRVIDFMGALLLYAFDTPDLPVPGGESFNAFRERFFGGLRIVLEEYFEGQIGIVTHHRSERLLKAWAKAGFPGDGSIDIEEFKLRGAPTGYCGVLEIPIERLPSIKPVPAFGDGREEDWQAWRNNE